YFARDDAVAIRTVTTSSTSPQRFYAAFYRRDLTKAGGFNFVHLLSGGLASGLRVSTAHNRLRVLIGLNLRKGSMLSKQVLRSRANGDSCLGGGRRVGDDGAAGPRSAAALL